MEMWIGLPIGDVSVGAHVTIVIRQPFQDGDLEHMKMLLEEHIKPLLPIIMKVESKTVMRGYQGNVPTKVSSQMLF